MPLGLKHGQQLIQQHHFACIHTLQAAFNIRNFKTKKSNQTVPEPSISFCRNSSSAASFSTSCSSTPDSTSQAHDCEHRAHWPTAASTVAPVCTCNGSSAYPSRARGDRSTCAAPSPHSPVEACCSWPWHPATIITVLSNAVSAHQSRLFCLRAFIRNLVFFS